MPKNPNKKSLGLGLGLGAGGRAGFRNAVEGGTLTDFLGHHHRANQRFQRDLAGGLPGGGGRLAPPGRQTTAQGMQDKNAAAAGGNAGAPPGAPPGAATGPPGGAGQKGGAPPGAATGPAGGAGQKGGPGALPLVGPGGAPLDPGFRDLLLGGGFNGPVRRQGGGPAGPGQGMGSAPPAASAAAAGGQGQGAGGAGTVSSGAAGTATPVGQGQGAGGTAGQRSFQDTINNIFGANSPFGMRGNYSDPNNPIYAGARRNLEQQLALTRARYAAGGTGQSDRESITEGNAIGDFGAQIGQIGEQAFQNDAGRALQAALQGWQQLLSQNAQQAGLGTGLTAIGAQEQQLPGMQGLLGLLNALSGGTNTANTSSKSSIYG